MDSTDREMPSPESACRADSAAAGVFQLGERYSNVRRREDDSYTESDTARNGSSGILSVGAGVNVRPNGSHRPQRARGFRRRHKTEKQLKHAARAIYTGRVGYGEQEVLCYADKPISFRKPRPYSPELIKFWQDEEEAAQKRALSLLPY